MIEHSLLATLTADHHRLSHPLTGAYVDFMASAFPITELYYTGLERADRDLVDSFISSVDALLSAGSTEFTGARHAYVKARHALCAAIAKTINQEG